MQAVPDDDNEPEPMDDREDPMDENEEEQEDDEYGTPTRSTAAPTKPSKAKRMRRRGVIYCRHGCGFKFVSPSAQGNKKAPADRKLRDQFDYHEQQQCPMLPRLVCPLECQYRGKVLSFAGPKALRQHFKTKSHQRAVELRKQPVDLSRPVLEADYAPQRVHGNPRTHGFRKNNPGDPKSAGRSKRHKAAAAAAAPPDPTAEYVTVDVDILMDEPAEVLGMSAAPPPPPDARDAAGGARDQAVFARSSRSLEKMQRVMALGALASRRLTPDRPAVVVEVVRVTPAKAEVGAPTLTARQIKTVFRGLRFV